MYDFGTLTARLSTCDADRTSLELYAYYLCDPWPSVDRYLDKLFVVPAL